MRNMNSNLAGFKRWFVDVVLAAEGVSSYPLDRIEQLQAELAVVKAESERPCQCTKVTQP
jgi:hypothetical protein